MSSEGGGNLPTLPNWLGEAAKNLNLPTLLLGPAGAAVSRLIGGATDIPAAWLQAKADELRSTSEARRSVKLSLADAAGAKAISQPDLVDQALLSFLPDYLRKQSNRESVAQKALEDLSRNSDPSTVAGEPEADWMNVFARYAEDATSERLQELWGRVLSGQIRSPKAFSLATLRFLAEIEMEIARDFESLEDELLSGSFLLKSATERHKFHKLNELENAGLLAGVRGLGGLARAFKIEENGHTLLETGEFALHVMGEPGKELSVEVIALTAVGRQVATLMPRLSDEKIKLERLAKVLSEQGADAIDLVNVPDGATTYEELVVVKELWRKP